MKAKIFLIGMLLVLIYLSTNQQRDSSLRVNKRHEVWGPTCRDLCDRAKGDLCGYVFQGCCEEGWCSLSWYGYSCFKGHLLVIPGCTSN